MHINFPWKFHQNVFTLTITFIVLNVSTEFVLIYRPHPVYQRPNATQLGQISWLAPFPLIVKDPIQWGCKCRSCANVPEFMDPVFAKTSPKRLFSMTENECFELVFAKTGSVNLGTGFFSWTRCEISRNERFQTISKWSRKQSFRDYLGDSFVIIRDRITFNQNLFKNYGYMFILRPIFIWSPWV